MFDDIKTTPGHDPANERRLYMAIIERAALDAYGVVSNVADEGAKEQIKRQAHIWFEGWSRESREDFEIICAGAGLDPDAVRAAYLDGRLRGILSDQGRKPGNFLGSKLHRWK